MKKKERKSDIWKEGKWKRKGKQKKSESKRKRKILKMSMGEGKNIEEGGMKLRKKYRKGDRFKER